MHLANSKRGLGRENDVIILEPTLESEIRWVNLCTPYSIVSPYVRSITTSTPYSVLPSYRGVYAYFPDSSSLSSEMHVLTSADAVVGQSFLWDLCLCVCSPMSAIPWISGFCCPVSIVGLSLYFMHRNLKFPCGQLARAKQRGYPEASACQSEKAPVGMSDVIHDLAVSTV